MSIYGDHALEELQIRNAISEAGRRAVGLGSTGPRERQVAYEEWLFPHPEDDRFQEAMADQMYSCALNARSCWFAALVDDPRLGGPYHRSTGAVVVWIADIGRKMGAYVDLVGQAAIDKAPALDFGDVLAVDAPAHWIVLTERLENGDFVTSEGGSPELGTYKDGTGQEKGMGIKTRVMRTRVVNGRLQTGTVAANGNVTWGRLALYAICAANLRRVE